LKAAVAVAAASATAAVSDRPCYRDGDVAVYHTEKPGDVVCLGRLCSTVHGLIPLPGLGSIESWGRIEERVSRFLRSW
jgi:hypothetical protein